MLQIISITNETNQLDLVRDLFGEYASELNEDLCFQSFEEELQNPLKKYNAPKGCILLATWNGEPAGCVALQPLQEGKCEMKRLYVRAGYRKHGIGDELVKAILKAAVERGFKKIVLDTLERLQPAIRLYTKYGFSNTSAYYKNPLSNVVYMEKDLTL